MLPVYTKDSECENTKSDFIYSVFSPFSGSNSGMHIYAISVPITMKSGGKS